MSNNGWIKLYRSMLDWEWYDDKNTLVLFIHLMLVANHKEKKWRGNIVKAGQKITSYSNLSAETGLTIQQIRTSLKKLKSTHEITLKTTSKFSLITLNNWQTYQSDNTQSNTRATIKQQSNNNKQECKNEKNEKKEEVKAEKIDVDKLWIKMITPYKGKYAPSMIEDFEDHWRAKNEGGKKEHWQKQNTFDIKRRLATWKRRGEGYQHQNEERQKLKFVNEKPTHRNDGGTRKQNRYFNSIGELIK